MACPGPCTPPRGLFQAAQGWLVLLHPKSNYVKGGVQNFRPKVCSLPTPTLVRICDAWSIDRTVGRGRHSSACPSPHILSALRPQLSGPVLHPSASRVLMSSPPCLREPLQPTLVWQSPVWTAAGTFLPSMEPAACTSHPHLSRVLAAPGLPTGHGSRCSGAMDFGYARNAGNRPSCRAPSALTAWPRTMNICCF